MHTNGKTAFTASQIAGSLRMEGILVSPRDESLMAAIIEGKVSIAEQRRRLVEQYKKQNTLI